MPTQPMVGCRVPAEWKERLETIATESGKNTAQVIYEAIKRYLETDEKMTIDAKIREALQHPETLEANPVVTALSQKLEAFEARLASLQKVLTTLNIQSEDNKSGKVMLTSEELALILGVTPRAVNDAASKGREHFTQWTERFRKGGKWTFEVTNPGMKKLDRRFIPI